MEIILFRLLITYYTRNCFPSRLQGTLLHKRDVHHDQNKFQQSIQQQQLIFMSHCEYSDITLIVDWILFVSSLEFTLPVFPMFPIFPTTWSRTENIFPVRHSDMRNTVKLVAESHLFWLLMIIYTRRCFPFHRRCDEYILISRGQVFCMSGL